MTVNLITIKDFKAYLEKELKDHYDETEISALSRIIIKTIFRGAGLHEIYNTRKLLTNEQSLVIKNIIRELKKGIPYQYVLGETIFYECFIKVTPSVLIPRPETEELVDLIIKENQNYKGMIIDIGTGSGCIAIALALNLPDSSVTGIDNSDEALLIAVENAILNDAPVDFDYNDILKFQHPGDLSAGIIVSNPPYVRRSERSVMKKNVLDYEPEAALFVNDEDPLIYYRAILDISAGLLIHKGKIYFEINEALGEEMAELLGKYNFRDIRIIRDLNNKDRIATGVKE